ncbi:putative gustatory receptor 28b [Venturia canescens]|uniref:putative gustatory receptor 28b n=1 Tax=Venturia canescens TaxID=32260 RepID=UPI001C9C8D56|nr:putative gustatory receptor 28b [Venturia canescens]
MKTSLIFAHVHAELIYSIPIIIIVIVCNWTTNEAVHTGALIHAIQETTADSKLYDVIKSFSLQLHHQKLEFTGGGLFPLDSKLLQTMAGKITTYLVILVQFQPKTH